jgi:hypothetical protein
MLGVPPARLPIENQMRFPIGQRAAPAIHGPTTSTIIYPGVDPMLNEENFDG